MSKLERPGWQRMIRAAMAFAVALGVSYAWSAHASAEEAPRPIEWRYHAGDDPRFADPAFDDRGWQPVRVPGGWQTQGLSSARGFGWYRMRFFVPAGTQEEPRALLLGRINNADEVFLNGAAVGRTGVVASGFVDARGKARLYELPREHLRPGSDNVLAVRVSNWFLPGGIVEGPVTLGPPGPLQAIAAAMDREFLVLAATQLGLVLTALAACLVLYAANRQEVPLVVFAVIVATWALWIVLDALPLLGIANRWMARIGLAGEVVLYLGWLAFSARCAAPRLNRSEVAVTAAGALLAVVALAAPAERLQVELYAAMNVLLAGVLALVLLRLLEVFRRREPRRWVLLAGAVCSVVLIAYAAVPLDLPTTLNPGLMALLMMTVFLGVDVYRRAAVDLREAARRTASIQATERSRIARDLHDDVAQSLGAVRLSLQLLQRQHADPALAAAVDELGTGLARVRGLAHELGDPVVRGKPFGELVRQHCRRLAQQSGVEFRHEVAPEADACVTGQDAENLFAILQEASGNAVRHASATVVSVTVAVRRQRVTLTIADDGRGFDPAQRHDGIGRWSMQQRALLLGGTVTIESVPGHGTVVAVEAPLRDSTASSPGD